MRQIIIDFGTIEIFGHTIPLRIPGYGLMLALGFLLGIYIARWRTRRSGENPDYLTTCGVLALIGGILGARLAYVIQHWQEQFASRGLGSILDVSSGGLIYYGGVVLATAMVLVYLKARRLPVRRYLDILAVSMMIGLAFGRSGCLLNGCCYGGEVREDFFLSQKFPMYSKPLLKLGNHNPYYIGTDSPSPVYAEQLQKGELHPDARLLDHGDVRGGVVPPRDLHGPLKTDQLAGMLGSEVAARAKFKAIVGRDGLVGREEWQKALARAQESPSVSDAAGGFLLGSEHWDEALGYNLNHDGRLSFEEAWQYLMARREWLTKKFDKNRDGTLDEAEQAAANAYLQADEFALAAAEWSRPVKPSEAIGIVNALLLAGLLTLFYRSRKREGQVFALLVILYPITRFWEEMIRDDNPHNLLQGVLTHNQYTSIAMLVAGVVLWLAIRRMPASCGPAWGERMAAIRLVKAKSKART